MAEIVPFPAARRKANIERLALQMMRNERAAAEAILRARLARHRECLERKSVSPRFILADLAAFEGAVRAVLWQHLIRQDGGAA